MRRLWTPAWIARHVAMVVLVTGFLALGWWQLSRAAGGNAISWGYAVEWPIFAGFVVFVWWREVRHALRDAQADPAGVAPSAATDPSPVAATAPADAATAPRPADAGAATATRPGGATATRPGVRRPVRVTRARSDAAEDDADLAAYNRYLSWLNANPGAKPGDYPG
ncbi:hypothetical protein [Micromonospora nigra]|nr:hypothetical protein [Micromonospora nigra]